MDRGGDIDRSILPQDKIGDDSDLPDKHRGEDEQAPKKSAPEFPDARWALAWDHRHRRGRFCGYYAGIHQLAFKVELTSRQRALQQAPDVVVGEIDCAVHAGMISGQPGACEQLRMMRRDLV